MTADMHVHTLASDGMFSPEEVVSLAVAAGLSALAVTDHDTVFNTEKVNTLCEKVGIKGIAGVEISAYVGDVKIHTLGYGFDLCSPCFAEFMNELYEGSLERASDIITKLSSVGVNLTLDEAKAQRAYSSVPVHAMHIARAAVKKGYGSSPFEFYKNYMMCGRAAYSDACRPTPKRAVEVINAAGGIAVMAHPGRIEMPKEQLRSLISELCSAGLGGIEAVYSTHTVSDTAYFKEIAGQFGLLITGGSDTHYGGGRRRIGSPVFSPSEELRQKLKI